MKHELIGNCTSCYVNNERFQDLTIDEMKLSIQELLDNTLDSNILQDVWITFVEGIGEYEDYISKYTVNI